MAYQLKQINALCPLCSSKAGILLFETDSESAAVFLTLGGKYFKKYFKIKKEIEKIWKGKTCKMIRCANCSFGYSYPFKAGTSEFYSLFYDALQYPSWKWEYSLTLREIKKLPLKNLNYLEVGAGCGAFARKAALIIKPENMLCTEYSRESADTIRRLGIKCINKNLQDFKDSDKFSIICLFQVLEHLDNLDKVFIKLKKISKPNADIFISVPDEENIDFCENKLGFRDFPPNHIGRFNIKVFDFLCEKYGFRIMDYKRKRYNTYAYFRDVSMGIRTIRSKKADSFENRIFAIRNKFLRRLFSLLLVPMYLVYAAYLKPKNKLATIQWIHLRNK